jgi:3' terminal RNA ribose 2'-O-methyltransferase Hen1
MEDTLVSLHDERLEVVTWHLKDSGARSVLDLGCGNGNLLVHLVEVPQFKKILGIDISINALNGVKQELSQHIDSGRLSLQSASFTEANDAFKGFDAAALIETIEHINPNELSTVERAVFGHFRPKTVIVTTPNVEYNVVYGLSPGEFRHPDHRFEWSQEKFNKWSKGIAERNHYSLQIEGIGDYDFELGHPTQMAIFRLQS